MSKLRLAWLAPLAIGAWILPLNCQNDVSAPKAPSGPTQTLAQLTSAPETLDFSQQRYTLTSNLWRDFMPVAPADGRPMTALVRLVRLDQQPIPDNVQLAYLWVINGKQVWATKLSGEPRKYDNVIERMAMNGPKWGPGISVDVVVGVTIGSSGLRLVRAHAQMIGRTD
jgi:hypothetical protein